MAEPRLVPQTRSFQSGYGPRSLRLAAGGTEIFVGCKDGTVTRVDLVQARAAPDTAAARVRAPVVEAGRPVGVRALCDLDDGWLIVGHDQGLPSALHWQGALDNRRPYRDSAVQFPTWAPFQASKKTSCGDR